MNYKLQSKQNLSTQIFKGLNKHTRLITFVFAFLLSLIFYLLPQTNLSAQVPDPYVDCDKTDNPEFGATRPYQKSPCNKAVSQTALYCGNSLILSDEVIVEQSTNPSNDPSCRLLDNGAYRCEYTVQKQTSIAIDLSNAEFPILGNSELAINSENYNKEPSSGFITDEEKVNEYVSWYLQGTPYTPEEEPLDMENQENVDRLVNFSGPLNKLLPLSMIHQQQINTIKSAGLTQHDQIVVCGSGSSAQECYKGAFAEVSPDLIKRLSDWDNDLDLKRTALNSILSLLGNLGLEEVEKNLKPWNKRYPPLIGDYEEEIYYQKAYNEWRGDSCLLAQLPFTDFKKLFCIDNPLIKNQWADLFPYVPLSSAEDRVGEVYVDSSNVSATSPDVEITDVELVSTPAKLYFAHTQEVSELANLLQSTFKSSDGGDKAISGKTYTNTSNVFSSPCYLLNIRSNPGDDLFAGEILGDLSYTAKFHCDFVKDLDDRTCRKDTSIGLSVKTKTPNAQDIWDTLVSGSSSVFKRIFPKVGEGSPILGILDIPGATKVTYSGDNLASVANPAERSDAPAELYFAHIGGVHEYFLKGIQTALRPKGFGESILSGNPDQFLIDGEANCNQEAPAANLPNLLSPQLMYEFAKRNVTYGENHVLQCYNDVAARAGAAGVDSIFTFTMWLRESNASNYSESIQDFGINDASVVGFVAQIEAFFRTVKSGGYKACACDSSKGWFNPMHGFWTMYRTGYCERSQTGDDYYDTTLYFWNGISSRPLNPNVLPTGDTCN